jgi:hypothetical protein
VFFSLQIVSTHWSLVIICMPSKEDQSGLIILHLDSLKFHRSRHIFSVVERYVVSEVKKLITCTALFCYRIFYLCNIITDVIQGLILCFSYFHYQSLIYIIHIRNKPLGCRPYYLRIQLFSCIGNLPVRCNGRKNERLIFN